MARSHRFARLGGLLLVTLVATGCATRVPMAAVIPLTSTEPKVPLRSLQTVAVAIPGDGRTLTLVGAGGQGVSSEGATSAVDLLRRAGDLMHFELKTLGFRVVADTSGVDAIAELSLGKVGFDSQRGWRAENAVLVFRRPNVSQPVAGFRTWAQFALPGADSLVIALGRIVKTKY